MRIVILGGGGFIGKRLAGELTQNGGLAKGTLKHLTLVDVAFSGDRMSDPRIDYMEADLSKEAVMRKIVGLSPDVIFHLAAIVSGEAEKNLDLGMRVNFHASLQLLELCRELSVRPRIVFSSSVAVFGGDVSQVITDDTAPKPRSSYGTEKAMVELLMNDYSRRGFVDACTLRLPTIAVRPGKPNAATSSFISGIIREPLNGQRASYPVPADCSFWIQSPRRVIRNLIHAANIDDKLLDGDRTVTLPGLTVSIQQMLDSLGKVAGTEVLKLISYAPDAFLQSIVLTWPPHFNTHRANELGFVKDASVDEIIRTYVEEEGIAINKRN